MIIVPKKDANAVASNTAVESIPAAESIDGLTARIYAIVINVVTPPITSLRTVVLFSFSLKNFSNISLLLSFVTVIFLHK